MEQQYDSGQYAYPVATQQGLERIAESRLVENESAAVEPEENDAA